MLETEKRAFERLKPELLQRAAGKFALIVGDQLEGTFDTEGAAYEAGISKYGNVPMLIQRISTEQENPTIPALTLGILHADL